MTAQISNDLRERVVAAVPGGEIVNRRRHAPINAKTAPIKWRRLLIYV